VIDTHAHLQSVAGGAEAAVERAAGAGVERIVCIGQSPAEARDAVAVARRHEGVRATAGLHPHFAAEWDAALERELDALLAEPEVVAVGECGLDHYRDRAPRDAQARAFEGQVALAERHRLPLVIHTRDAAEPTLAVLRATRAPVVLHCFSLPERLEEASERGWYVSFAGNVTYPKSTELQEAARRVPLELLLLETDAPYLAPVPFRGRPNSPEHVLETLRFVASLRELEPSELERAVDANAARAFPRAGWPA
jgi:TatD DNase family protein